MLRMVGVVALGLAVSVAAYGTAAAGATPGQKCQASKLKAAGKGIAGEMGCQSKEKAKPTGGLAACLSGVHTKTAAAINKVGTTACDGTPATIQPIIDACADTTGTLPSDVPGNSKCTASSAKALGKGASGDIGCQVKEITKPGGLTACRSAGDAKTNAALLKAGACSTGTPTTDIHNCTTSLAAAVPIPCNCCSKTLMNFTTGLPSATATGEILDDTGAHVIDLTSGGLYFGGGLDGVPLPAAVPSQGVTQTAITACNPGTGAITIGSRSAAQTGSNANCSAVGCLFGPPLPIPNPTGTATSTCVVNVVSTNAAGNGNCNGNITSLNLPLNSGIYLTGDLDPSINGIQPCPICTGGTCKGGPNDGLACTPGTTTTGAGYPTSNDCPPPSGSFLGNLPIAFDLSTGVRAKTAVDNVGVQTNVFCGFCATGAGVFQNPANACATNATCTTGTFTKCRQRDQGAFATDALALNTARTITETGSPSACLADGASHNATLVSVFCIPPTFNGLVDGSASLPGPGAVALGGSSQLLP